MRYNTTINNIKAHEWGLNIQQAYLFAWFYELPSWADKMVLENKVYYFASKSKAVKELPLLTEKTDTMYRYYRQIEDLGLIEIKKIDNKDYIYLTEKGKQWNGNKSERSEINPTKLGNKSDNSSEKNPTYNNINNNNTISNNIESAPEKFCFTSELIKMGLDKTLASEWMKIRKKSKNTEKALELFKNELNKSGLNINDFVSIAVANGWQMPKSNYEEVRIAKIKQNDIEKRKNDFKAVLSEFIGKVDKDTLNDFYRYYTQANDENIMLFEQIAFFNVAYRLFNHKKNK